MDVDAKKALKKLKKHHHKVQSNALRQLKNLSHTRLNRLDNEIKDEVKAVSEAVVTQVLSELSTPFDPVLSWFREGQHIDIKVQQPAQQRSPSNLQVKKSMPTIKVKRSVMHLPLKSPPCKRCPALANGICKCAAKRFQ